MESIVIKNERYDFIIYDWGTAELRFNIYDKEKDVTPVRHVVQLPDNTDPKDWLHAIVNGGALDAEGRIVSVGSSVIYFDGQKGNSPRLFYMYYGFTHEQIKEALSKKEVKPDWPDWVRDGATLSVRYDTLWYLDGHYLSELNNTVTPPLLTDHLDKSKTYVKG